MAINSWPFDGQTVTETEFSRWADALAGRSGILNAGDFEVSAGSGFTLSSAPGFGIVRGHAVDDTAAEDLTLDPADSQPRIDRIVLELDPSKTVPATVVRKVVKGTPGVSPAAPALTQTVSGVFQFPLARVAVAADSVNIVAANITDDRVLLQGVTWLQVAGKPSTFAPIIGPASTQAVAGNDPRLTNARVPVLHEINHPSYHSGVLTVANGGTGATTAVAARAALGAQAAGSYQPAGSYAASSHTHPVSQISDATTVGEALVKATSETTARAAIGISYGTANPSGGVDGDIYFKVV